MQGAHINPLECLHGVLKKADKRQFGLILGKGSDEYAVVHVVAWLR